MSFCFDTGLKTVIKDKQKPALANSETQAPNQPPKLHVTRHGGFADIETIFDDKTHSFIGRNASVYGQVEFLSSIDHLTNEARDKSRKLGPDAVWLQSNRFDAAMPWIIHAKDLPSSVIGRIGFPVVYALSGIPLSLFGYLALLLTPKG